MKLSLHAKDKCIKMGNNSNQIFDYKLVTISYLWILVLNVKPIYPFQPLFLWVSNTKELLYCQNDTTAVHIHCLYVLILVRSSMVLQGSCEAHLSRMTHDFLEHDQVH